MFRLIEDKINKWLKDSDKALVIRGARQVGKTYIIEKVLDESNTPYIELNLANRPDVVKALDGVDDVNDVIEKILLYSGKALTSGIIFLDEIQELPELVTKLKFLVQDRRYRYIFSGSLLGIEIKNIRSVPVGYMEELTMYPMTFKEFVIANKIPSSSIDYIEKCYEDKQEIDELIHKDFMRLFNIYLIVGGMPDVVKTFIKTKNLEEVNNVQNQIINQYKEDFTKYERKDKKLNLIDIYDSMINQLNKQNLKFIFSDVNDSFRFSRNENSFIWLKDAGVAYPCFISNELNLPLSLSKDKTSFKLFFNDVGLLSSHFSVPIKLEMLNDNSILKINKGSIYENFVMQELVASGFTPYYYKSKNIGELDFLVEQDLKLKVIEVKSGKDYEIHRALNKAIESNDKLDDNIVFSPYNIKQEDKITYLPIYMTYLLAKQADVNPIIDLGINLK